MFLSKNLTIKNNATFPDFLNTVNLKRKNNILLMFEEGGLKSVF